MLKETITYINQLLLTSGMVQKAHGLCDILEKDGRKFPAEYCLGVYKEVSDFAKHKGVVYHRLNGSVSVSQSEGYSACGTVSEKSYKISMIYCVPKNIIGNDNNDGYAEITLFENIEAIISSQNSAGAIGLNANYVSIEVTGVNYDRYSVFKKEYSDVVMKVPFEYAYMSIDYQAKIESELDCYTQVTCN